MENNTTQNNTELELQNDTEMESQNYTEIEQNDTERPKKKYDFYVELVLFLILGILIGIALKTEAVKRITIGYDDYKMKIMKSDFDINKIEKDILQKQKDEAQKQDVQEQIDGNQAIQ
ncbi:MAG: hypothetical protein WC678_01995 [Parcubacteria group bacterium]|jgi:hypothetical protein